jgi:dTDP-D-glucose 4,6-dehydratase
VLHFVKKYPNYNIVNLDKMDYCSSTYYFKEAESLPNYKFVKVRAHLVIPFRIELMLIEE